MKEPYSFFCPSMAAAALSSEAGDVGSASQRLRDSFFVTLAGAPGRESRWNFGGTLQANSSLAFRGFGSRLHQLVVDELIWIGLKTEITAKRTIQGEDHEDDQAHEKCQENDLNFVQ